VASVAQIRSRYRNRRTVTSSENVQAAGRARHRALEDQLASLKCEHDDLSRSMYEAAQVQRRLCGPRHLRAGSYEFASEIFPARHLSGDFISVMQLEGELVFVIGDIAGKGPVAAMWFTHVVGVIRQQILSLGDPAAALTAVNRDLLFTGLEVPLTTLFLARVNLESGELIYCNAGHPPALLIHESNEVEELSAGGSILGVNSGTVFANGIAVLYEGDTLLAYSDGVTECRNESGIEFGTDELIEEAKRLSGSNPRQMLFSVLAAVENFAGSQHREDDIALVVLRRFSS
jgi:sigma-B regulation protein RsbU (phosphoserine phosphatase)